MPLFLKNIRKVLRPSGRVLFRDYATGDLAQERLSDKQQKIGDNFFVRGDGTRAYYFSTDFLRSLFMQNGFDVEKIDICNKQVENRSKEVVMKRRWIQAVFSSEYQERIEDISLTNNSLKNQKVQNDTELDLSDSMVGMFNLLPSINEVIEITVRGCSFKIKALTREYQHTCKSTGLMLWESARLMCNLIAETPSVVEGRNVLELGCGSAGICSMVSAQFAKVVVATDGDVEALNLLRENVSSNLDTTLLDKIAVSRLIWGNREDMKITKDLSSNGVGFDVIIGTDVTYNYDAISPLFETARELISCQGETDVKPALILCHMQRRVDEGSILSTATQFGFGLVDKWVNNNRAQSSDGIISSWFTNHSGYLSFFNNTPLTILYFNA